MDPDPRSPTPNTHPTAAGSGFDGDLPQGSLRSSFFERHWRWFVLGTLFLATFLNYLDRQTLSNAADPICAEFGLDNAQRGRLLATFVYTYAAAHLFIGPLIDRTRNFRLVFPIFVLGWSLCNLLVGFARDYATLLWLRAALGVFEAANFPVCLLLIARIFPAKERVLANGIFYSGAVIATLVAPKFVIYVASMHHWRWATTAPFPLPAWHAIDLPDWAALAALHPPTINTDAFAYQACTQFLAKSRSKQP